MSGVKTAMMRVSDVIAEAEVFRLPVGFKRGEQRFIGFSQCYEVLVTGPFPDDLPDFVDGGHPEVTAWIAQHWNGERVDRLSWQWAYDGKPIGAPIEMGGA